MAQVRDAISVTIAGAAFTLDRATVEERMRDVLPDPVKDHFAVVGGRRFPPKQVVSRVTGLDRADFTTHQARRILRRLGFAVGRKDSGASMPAPPSEAGARGRSEADILRPYIGKWVAQKDLEVLVAADTPEEVVEWLYRHDMQADGMFRVPASRAEMEMIGPY